MELLGALVLLWRWEASGDFTPGLLLLLLLLGKAFSRLRCLCMLKSRVPFSSTSMSAACNCEGKSVLVISPLPMCAFWYFKSALQNAQNIVSLAKKQSQMRIEKPLGSKNRDLPLPELHMEEPPLSLRSC